jgi:hypothetical protein
MNKGELIETYRGVEIRFSKVAICPPQAKPAILHDYYIARVGEWLIIGTLESVRDQIDKRLGRRDSQPG